MRRPALVLTVGVFLLTSLSVGQWGPDIRLTNDGSASRLGYNNARNLAAGGETLHVVWSDTRDGNEEIYYKRSNNAGRDWQADVRLSNATGSSWYPAVAATGNDVHVIWKDDRTGTRLIYHRCSTDGGQSWSETQCLSDTLILTGNPALAATERAVHLVCHRFDNEVNRICYRRSEDRGSTWSSPLELSPDSISSWIASIAVSGADVHVVWSSDQDGDQEVYYRRSTDHGESWGEGVRITSDTAPSVNVAVASTGTDVHIVWQYVCTPGQSHLRHAVSTDRGTTWQASAQLTTVPTQWMRPTIAASGGFVHIVTNLCRPSEELYYWLSTDRGSSWEPEYVLTPDDSATSICPFIALSVPIVHVVWEEYRDGNSEIYYKQNPNGSSGIGEIGAKGASHTRRPASAVRAVLQLRQTQAAELLDISGRRVMDLCPGENDVRHLAPGVYFVRTERGAKAGRVLIVR
ncbi:MAG: exo-alpha-sialidase [candidate division WOR-3 bacterium]|nr:MAG: exo-alpha-sialidase [candidate division WOR-3 bacterium]